MDNAQHYPNAGLVFHSSLSTPHLQSVSTAQSFSQDMSWQSQQHSPSDSASSAHAQMPSMMSHVQHPHATHSAVQQSFVPRHVSDPFASRPTYGSVDPGPSTQQLAFDSPQVEGSIGPDRGRRRMRMPERVMSHGEIPEYAAAVPQQYGVRPIFFHFVVVH